MIYLDIVMFYLCEQIYASMVNVAAEEHEMPSALDHEWTWISFAPSVNIFSRAIHVPICVIIVGTYLCIRMCRCVSVSEGL